ncbi:MAG: flagellar assembly protein FliH [Spirochaetes bacterium]|nr:flagellar assembly protein FliH [Spirochaetota bacterium]
MAKSIFKGMEIVPSNIKVSIDIPKIQKKIKEVEEVREPEIYNGKTVEEIKREAEIFEKEFTEKKHSMIYDAEANAKAIIERARNEAFEIIKKKNDEAQEIRTKAEDEAKTIIEEARVQAKKIESEIQDTESKILTEARKRGYQDGWEEGYGKGSDEVKRLIERVQIILNASIQKRNEIFIETEQQIIGLVLLIAKKVIKVISENQKNVVINNVIQALRKLKSRGEVAIRVNLADLELTSQHKRDFVEMVEGIKSIKILEDSTVDRGGCIIDTDFGSIDARISSQLHEIEDKILELMPIYSKGKQDTSTPV